MINKDYEVVSEEEMRDNLDVIKRHLPIFKLRFDNASNKIDRDLTAEEMDIIIKESLNEGNLNFAEKRVLGGFYESWMVLFMMVGNDKEALKLLFQHIGV